MVNIWPIIDHITGGRCPLCHQPGQRLCPPCAGALPHNHRRCPRCALPLPPGVPPGVCCAECQARAPAFDLVVAPLIYERPVDELVAGFKYHHRLQLGPLLAGIVATAARRETAGATLLLPVPMSAARLRERGFNQAAELARCLAREVGIPWAADRLIRIRESGHQQTLGRRSRRRNVRGIFAAHGDLPPRVALIDDVMTTGATADQARWALKAAGADWVEVWTVARTPKEQKA